MEKTKQTTTIDSGKILKAAELFHAVGHPLRLSIIQFLSKKREANVNMIYKSLKLEQSITSKHLKILLDVNAVEKRMDGQKAFYIINEETFCRLNKSVSAL